MCIGFLIRLFYERLLKSEKLPGVIKLGFIWPVEKLPLVEMWSGSSKL